MVYYAVNGLVSISCVCAVVCLTGWALVVVSVFVVLLCRDVLTAESRVNVWRL